MLQQPMVLKWTIAVSTRKKADADRRAAWIREHLVARGVAESRFQVVTGAGDEQIGFLVSERADGEPGNVCPAGSEVVPRSPAAAPAPAPLSTPAPSAQPSLP